MTTTETAPAKRVTCTECRHENEAERIYCHNCGERLDRSAIFAQKKAQAPEDERRRLQKMMEGPSKTRQNFFAVAKLALAAAALAALVQMALPPDLPAPTKIVPPQIDLDLENAAMKSATLEYSQEQINAYLAYRLTSKKTALNEPLLTFVRATASFGDGTCTIGMERSLFGYSLFTRASYRVGTNGGKVDATNVGGWIGRFPIHPAIMQFGQIALADLFKALDRETKLLGKMSAVNFHDGGVTISAAR